MIFWWFFDDFWKFCFKRENQTKPRKSSKNHQTIIKKSSFCLEKQWKSTILASFLGFFMQNDNCLMIFSWFLDDFLGFVWFSLLKQNPKIIEKSSKNHRKIIVLLEKQWNPGFWQVFLFFSNKTIFFDDFSMIFEGFASKEKIIQNLGNHQKIIVLLEKAWKSKILASFLSFFEQNDDFLIIFWRFFDDFWRFCFKRENQTKPRKS